MRRGGGGGGGRRVVWSFCTAAMVAEHGGGEMQGKVGRKWRRENGEEDLQEERLEMTILPLYGVRSDALALGGI